MGVITIIHLKLPITCLYSYLPRQQFMTTQFTEDEYWDDSYRDYLTIWIFLKIALNNEIFVRTM